MATKRAARTEIQQEIVDLIRFYEKRGSDWTSAAEFTLVKHSGNLDKILNRKFVRPWKYETVEREATHARD
jgi:hypothetical protein